MSAPLGESEAPCWTPPPESEWDDPDEHILQLPGQPVETDRVRLTLVNHVTSCVLVQFTLIQQVRIGSKWHNVALAKPCHPEVVHFHQYGRTGGEQDRSTEVLRTVGALADIQAGYVMAYERVFERWAENKERWHNG